MSVYCFLSLAVFSNYYIGFMLCVFLVLYWLVWVFRKRRTLKDIFNGGWRFAVGSLWGAGMVAALLIPVALALGRTSAAGGELGDFRTNFDIFDLFGRRIETPAATGIYIVDGKKQVIKK